MQIQILFDVAITPNLAVGNNQSFGTPDLVLLADGTVLLTYYTTLQGIIHVNVH